MTDKFFKTPSAVIVLLTKIINGKTQVLCQRRNHTEYAEGLFEFSCSGKVESGESMKCAAVREAKEELGVDIKAEDLNFFCLEHKREEQCDLVFYKAYFIVDKFSGEPKICESEKCSELKWFPLDSLPSDMIEENKTAAKILSGGGHYFEVGWEK